MPTLQKLWKFLAFTDEEVAKFAVALIMGVGALAFSAYENYGKPTEIEESLTYETQVERLEQIQNSVKDLSNFVSQQTKQLDLARDTLQELEQEKKKLEPLVMADRKVAEAILQLQAEKERSAVWFDRAIGFMLGIAGSLIASIIYTGLRNRLSQ